MGEIALNFNMKSEDNIKITHKRSCEGMYWIKLIQGKIQWSVFLNIIMILSVKLGNSF
jgi:hypothetical protein